jgi:hypothetical protein
LLSIWLVSGSWPESPVSKVNEGWFLFLSVIFYIDLFQFHLLIFNLFEIVLPIFLFFPFIPIRLSWSWALRVNLGQLRFFLIAMGLITGSWPESLVSKVNVDWPFCWNFFKLNYFNFIIQYLIYWSSCFFFHFLSNGLSWFFIYNFIFHEFFPIKFDSHYFYCYLFLTCFLDWYFFHDFSFFFLWSYLALIWFIRNRFLNFFLWNYLNLIFMVAKFAS